MVKKAKKFFKKTKLCELIRSNSSDIAGSIIRKRKTGWKILWMLYLKTLRKWERKKYQKYNLYRDFFRMMYIPKPVYKKRKTRYTMYFYHRWQFSLFYGCLKTKYIKNAVRLSKKKKNSISYFIYLMELRIDVILYRLNLANSVREARQWVFHGKVVVNNLIVRNPSYVLKLNDFITVTPHLTYKLKLRLAFSIRWKCFMLSTIPNYLDFSLVSLIFKFTYFNVMDIPRISALNRNAYSHLVGLI